MVHGLLLRCSLLLVLCDSDVFTFPAYVQITLHLSSGKVADLPPSGKELFPPFSVHVRSLSNMYITNYRL